MGSELGFSRVELQTEKDLEVTAVVGVSLVRGGRRETRSGSVEWSTETQSVSEVWAVDFKLDGEGLVRA